MIYSILTLNYSNHVGFKLNVPFLFCILSHIQRDIQAILFCVDHFHVDLDNYDRSSMEDHSTLIPLHWFLLLGLELKLFVELGEYVPEIRESLGFRVVVHDQTQVPFPEDQGFNISPGYHSMLGIRKVRGRLTFIGFICQFIIILCFYLSIIYLFICYLSVI